MVIAQNPLLSKHGASESPVVSWYHAGNVVAGSTGPNPVGDNAACDAGAKTSDNSNITRNGTTLNFIRMAYLLSIAKSLYVNDWIPAEEIDIFYSIKQK
jgi:hypothetical protein